MLRRDFVALCAITALAILPPVAAHAQGDDDDSGSGGGDDSGRGRGRGGDDTGFDDRGGGYSSGHGSAEERAAVRGDDRADRAEARLREDVKENLVRDRELSREDRELSRRASGPTDSGIRSDDSQTGGSRGFFADLFGPFRER
jgi:hypothetical protein